MISGRKKLDDNMKINENTNLKSKVFTYIVLGIIIDYIIILHEKETDKGFI